MLWEWMDSRCREPILVRDRRRGHTTSPHLSQPKPSGIDNQTLSARQSVVNPDGRLRFPLAPRIRPPIERF